MDDKIKLFVDLHEEREIISKLLNLIKRLNNTQSHHFNTLFIMTYPGTLIKLKTEFEIDDRADIIFSSSDTFMVDIEEYSIHVYVPKELADEIGMENNPQIYIIPLYAKESFDYGEEEKKCEEKCEEKVEYEIGSKPEAIEFLSEESQGSYKILYVKENIDHVEEEKNYEEKAKCEGDNKSEAIEFLLEESQGSYKITDSD